MFSQNHIEISGYLGGNAETAVVGGKTIAKFSIAHSPYVGKGKKQTDWYSVIVWAEALADACKSLKKGDHVSVTGTITIRKWGDPEKTMPEVSAAVVLKVERIGEPTTAPATTETNAAPQGQPMLQSGLPAGEQLDDLPF